MPQDYPDFRIPISLAQQEVDLDMIIKACEVVLNTTITTCEVTIDTVVKAVEATINTIVTGQTIDLSTIIEACNVILDINLKTSEATINQIITGQTVDITQVINGQNVGVYDRRDWAAKEAEYKSFGVTQIPFVGGVDYIDIYTVPASKVFFLTDYQIAPQICGLSRIYYGAFNYLVFVRYNPYDVVIGGFSLPRAVAAEEVIYSAVTSQDIQVGGVNTTIIGWEQPASVPEKPKNDSPEELYRTGTFNVCQVIKLDEANQVFIFRKHKDKTVNYLKYKDYSRPNQKKLASFKMEADEAEEIIDTAMTFPQKVKEVVNKYEQKYKDKG